MSSVQCLQIFSKYLVADYQIKVRERERESWVRGAKCNGGVG